MKCILEKKLKSENIMQKKALIESIFKKHIVTKNFEKPTQKVNKAKFHQNTLQVSVSMSETKKDEVQRQLTLNGLNCIESPPIKVPWFPMQFSDINLIGKTLFKEQHWYDSSHPYFQDSVYRKRRDKIVQIAYDYKIGEEIPTLDYTGEQHQLWRGIVRKLRPLHRQYFCEKYQQKFSELNKRFKIEEKIPQLSELSHYLHEQTGWRIKPVHGIISPREFLNALAFKVFFSTQYLRHKYTPQYAPQPDIVHEIIGHVPMFADKHIADLSQKIGLISLGASDEQIKKLGGVYFFTIEFGVCNQNGANKAYGAGLASCIKQIMNLSDRKTHFKRFEAKSDCSNSFKIHDLQSVYYVTESFESALQEIQKYSKEVSKPIRTTYNEKKQCIEYNRSIDIVSLKGKNL